MRKTLGLLFLPFLLSCSNAQQLPVAKPTALVLTHVTVIDVTGMPARPNVTVVVTGDRITHLGASAEVHAPKGSQIVDATGKFLIPGLWDMHIHWYLKDYLHCLSRTA